MEEERNLTSQFRALLKNHNAKVQTFHKGTWVIEAIYI